MHPVPVTWAQMVIIPYLLVKTTKSFFILFLDELFGTTDAFLQIAWELTMFQTLWISHAWSGKSILSKLLLMLISKTHDSVHSIICLVLMFYHIDVAVKIIIAALVDASVFFAHILGSIHFLQELIFFFSFDILAQRFVMVER